MFLLAPSGCRLSKAIWWIIFLGACQSVEHKRKKSSERFLWNEIWLQNVEDIDMLIKSKLNDIANKQNVGEITLEVHKRQRKEKYHNYVVFMLSSNNDNLTLFYASYSFWITWLSTVSSVRHKASYVVRYMTQTNALWRIFRTVTACEYQVL